MVKEFSFWSKIGANDGPSNDFIWSLPERSSTAPSLIIVGGKSESISGVSALFEGCGSLTLESLGLYLPKSVNEVVPDSQNIHWVGSNSLGAFQESPGLDALISASRSADVTIFSRDIRLETSTGTLLRRMFYENQSLKSVLFDAIAIFRFDERQLLIRDDCVVVLNVELLQRLLRSIKWHSPATSSMSAVAMAMLLKEFTEEYREARLIIDFKDDYFIARGGEVASIAKSHIVSFDLFILKCIYAIKLNGSLVDILGWAKNSGK